jgi:hypothetical protein
MVQEHKADRARVRLSRDSCTTPYCSGATRDGCPKRPSAPVPGLAPQAQALPAPNRRLVDLEELRGLLVRHPCTVECGHHALAKLDRVRPPIAASHPTPTAAGPDARSGPTATTRTSSSRRARSATRSRTSSSTNAVTWRGSGSPSRGGLDRFSSAATFDGWKDAPRPSDPSSWQLGDRTFRYRRRASTTSLRAVSSAIFPSSTPASRASFSACGPSGRSTDFPGAASSRPVSLARSSHTRNVS